MAIDPDLPFVLAALAIISGTVISVVRTLVNRRPPQSVGAPELQAIEERLNRIEQAIDSIAVETERISEGQRFTTKLLSQAPRQASGGAPRGVGGLIDASPIRLPGSPLRVFLYRGTFLASDLRA